MNRHIRRTVLLPMVSMVAYSGTAAAFICEYLPRVATSPVWAVSLLPYLLLPFAVFYLQKKTPLRGMPLWGLLVSVLLFAAALCVLQLSIDPYSLRVDRWSAIHNFLDRMLQGEYPYAARTHLGGYGSPFPVWQILHLPFYFLGDVGLSLVLAVVLFVHSLYKVCENKASGATVGLFLLCAAPSLWYECAVRSDLVTNFLLICAIMNYCCAEKLLFVRNYRVIAVACGLLLSTRLSVAVPLAIFFFKDFLGVPVKAKCEFLVIAIVIFCLTFLPFAIWGDGQLFWFKYNPFELQTRQGTIWEVIVLIPVGIVLAMKWKNHAECLFYSGLMLLLVVLLAWTVDAVFFAEDGTFIDLTYLDMALPFFIAAVAICFSRPRKTAMDEPSRI